MLVKVKNRSKGRAAYTLPQYKDRANLRREFARGEIQEIDEDELYALTFIPGGKVLLEEYLQVNDPEVVKRLGLNVEPEYNMSEEDIKDILKNGSLDAFLDCLDFAPSGVLDLVKKYAVDMPVTDTAKRRAIKEKLGLDVDAAIQHNEESAAATNEKEQPKKERRVKVEENSGRRTNIPDYEVVVKKDDKV